MDPNLTRVKHSTDMIKSFFIPHHGNAKLTFFHPKIETKENRSIGRAPLQRKETPMWVLFGRQCFPFDLPKYILLLTIFVFFFLSLFLYQRFSLYMHSNSSSFLHKLVRKPKRKKEKKKVFRRI